MMDGQVVDQEVAHIHLMLLIHTWDLLQKLILVLVVVVVVGLEMQAHHHQVINIEVDLVVPALFLLLIHLN
jgi:hypothetical protein